MTRGLLRIGVSVGLLVALAWFLDGTEVAARLTGLRPGWALAALAVSALQMLVLAWRWKYTAARLDVDLGFGEALREYYLATFVNQVLPGGVLGDVGRAWRHAQQRRRAQGAQGPAVRAVILERASAQVVMTGAAVASLAALPVGAAVRTVAVLVAGAVVVTAGVVTVRSARRGARDARASGQVDPPPPQAAARSPGAAPVPHPATVSGISDGVPVGLAARTWADTRAALVSGTALPVQVASAAFVVGTYIATYLMAARAIGVDTPVAALVPLVAPVLLAMLIPVTVAGWGLREGAAAVLWGAVGLPPAQGVAISIAYGVLIFVASLPGAGVGVYFVALRSRSNSTSFPSRK